MSLCRAANNPAPDMDFTSRMAALLGAFRRERNGAVADSMRLYGKPYGLNYGVSLPTLRTLARAEGTDHEFARYLYQQDVRCLRPTRRASYPPNSPSGAADCSTPNWPKRPLSLC